MKVEKVLEVVNGKIINDCILEEINEVKIDSRKITENDLFIAIKGEQFDGHDYVLEAIKKGAKGVIIEKEMDIQTDVPIIKVDNTIDALCSLGQHNRELHRYKTLIAITGSAGKTTTKELLAKMLETKYKVLKNEASYNNNIGLPLTLLKLDDTYDIIVTELGMNHFNEISKLSQICKPNYAIITNIGSAHIGNLGSKKNILKAKLEIIDGMYNGYILLNGDDKYLKKINSLNNLVIEKEGIKHSTINIASIEYLLDCTKFEITYKNKNYNFVFPIPGKHLLIDVVLAVKMALTFGIEIEDIIEVVNNYTSVYGRMNIIKHKNMTIIDDSYNCSFEALMGSLNLLEKDSRHKIIVIGDMLELGVYSKWLHFLVNRQLKKIENKTVLLVGDHTKIIDGIHFDSSNQLKERIHKYLNEDSVIFIKGSLKMNLKSLTNYIIKNL